MVYNLKYSNHYYFISILVDVMYFSIKIAQTNNVCWKFQYGRVKNNLLIYNFGGKRNEIRMRYMRIYL